MMNTPPRPLLLIILDGWGHRDETDANAIYEAKKPNWDALWQQYPHMLISGSGKCVGLPDGQMGNSEVGHLNMGAGRIVYQDLTRIDLAIEEGDFFKNPTLVQALTLAQQSAKSVHIMGLLSPGGVHSHEKQFFAMLDLAGQYQLPGIYCHAFLDGRDTPPKSAASSLESLHARCQRIDHAHLASIIGRYYAMDRDKRWERVKEAYELIVEGKAKYSAKNAMQALDLAYERGETDEFVQATTIHAPGIKDGDVIIFMNFRADRARELTQSLTDLHFQGFTRAYTPQLGAFVALSEYDKRFKVAIAFPPITLNAIFAQCLSDANLTQLRIAETEKYAHVTFFFNGGIEQPYPGEERILIPSPKVATYDLQPEMSAYPLTSQLVAEIKKKKHDVIICNFANPDMLGHTGNFAATVKAIEVIDDCLGTILAAIKETGGEVIITADHGNAEKMYNNESKQPHTAHTSDPVPFLYIGNRAKICEKEGKLSDIAPTMLALLGLPQPVEMTGKSLLKLV